MAVNLRAVPCSGEKFHQQKEREKERERPALLFEAFELLFLFICLYFLVLFIVSSSESPLGEKQGINKCTYVQTSYYRT